MTTTVHCTSSDVGIVVEAYRLDRYDNYPTWSHRSAWKVVEAYRLDRYDNFGLVFIPISLISCRSLSFG